VFVVGVEGEFVVRDADSRNPTPSPQIERRFANPTPSPLIESRFAQSVNSPYASRRPVIGITGYAHIPENVPLGLPIIGARSADVHAVQLAGGLAFLLPPISDADEIDQVLDLVDGLLFTGGRDVDPAEYGETPVNDTVVVTPERDAFELPLMRRAVARDLPVLAICRGCQVMGVALGGSLWQDLPSQKPDGLVHSQKEARAETTHTVRVEPNTRLQAILGVSPTEDVPTNTFHHQAIHRVPDGFVPTAYAPDGCIEAIEAPGRRFAVGVQWHPEFLAPGQEIHRRLFESLVSASRGDS